MKNVIILSLILLLLTACVAEETLAPTPTLDAMELEKTAIHLATLDHVQTQAIIPTQTLEPAFTWTPAPTLDRTRPSNNTPTAEKACNIAAAGHPFDVTVPDGTLMAPGETFSKTWRLENEGNCAWNRQYAVTFFSGNSMEALQNQFLAGEVAPGEVIDITVDMKAPEEPGVYQGNWMLIDPQGELFGIGPNGDAPFWVQIEVMVSVTDTPEPSPTPSKTPLVYLTGEAILADQDQMDLDSGTVNPEDAAEADFIYQQGETPAHTFSTLNGAEWAVMGEAEPGFDDCVSTQLTTNPLDFQDLPIGTHVCFKSSGGLAGWFFFEAFAEGQITIRFLTWSTSID
jgi:hypothetical protein